MRARTYHQIMVEIEPLSRYLRLHSVYCETYERDPRPRILGADDSNPFDLSKPFYYLPYKPHLVSAYLVGIDDNGNTGTSIATHCIVAGNGTADVLGAWTNKSDSNTP